MVWYFIGVYVITRTLHDRLEIRDNGVQQTSKIFFQHKKRNLVSQCGHAISSIYLHSYENRAVISHT